jgi:NADH-quinone oxidoreductase subunit L
VSDRLYQFSLNKGYVDEFYDAAIVRPGRKFANWLWRTADARMVDGTVNGVSGIIASLSRMLAGWQSGYARNYALTMLLGVVIVVIGCLFGLRMVGR